MSQLHNLNMNNNFTIELLESKIETIYEQKPQELEKFKIKDYYGFINLMGNMFKNYNINAPLFEEHNESFDSTPIIIHRLLSKRPSSTTKATYNQAAIDSGKYTKTLMPIRYSAYRNINEPGTITLVYMLALDYHMQFIPFSESTKESMDIADRIQQVIICFRDLIRYQGVTDIIYLETGEKIIKDINSTKLIGTPVNVFVKLHEFYEKKEEELQRIIASTSLFIEKIDVTIKSFEK